MSWPAVELQELALKQKGAIVSGPFGSNIGSSSLSGFGLSSVASNYVSVVLRFGFRAGRKHKNT